MDKTAKKKSILPLLLVVAGFVVLVVVYSLVDPSRTAWMPKCPVHTLTGLDCPGCGSQRAFHALLHGDLAGVAKANALLLLLFPYVAVVSLAEFRRHSWPRLYAALTHPFIIYAVVALVVGWGVVRNLIG